TNEPVFTITNEAGCDSIVTLDLTIRKSTTSPSQSHTAINTYTWNEMTYITSGVYTATLTNAVGCDSTATLDLTVLYQFPITYNVNDGVLPAEYPIDYIQGIGATLPIPTKLNNRFDGWYDNADFTGSPITAISNSASGNKQFWALWTVTQMNQNNSLSFSGSSSVTAQIANTPELNPTTAITLEAWIYPTAWRSNIYEGSIISKEIASGNGGYILRCGSSGKLSFTLGIGTAFQELATTTNVLTLNQWQHVAGTYDGTTMRIYLNGVEIGNKAQTGTINVSSNALEIGRNPGYSDRYFTGRIDEARIFNAALDAPTILTWYNKSLNNTHSNYANLVAYYEFDNASTPATFNGTVGPNGTITGANYVSNCTTPFITSSSIISAPSFISAVHPIPSHLTSMMPVVPGDTLAQILQVNVQSAIGGNITQIVLSTNGTTNPADITNARLWYTGTSTTFSTATLFGTPILNPNGTMTFNGSVPTICGSSYYFWLTYDIKPSATYNNVIDAEVVNCTVERLLITPIVAAPVGNRLIADPCKYQILQINDDFGDSWNGNKITVYKNNLPIYTDLTITVGSYPNYIKDIFEYPIFANIGDTIKIVKTVSGSYSYEMRVQLTDGKRNPMIFSIEPPAAPGLSAIAGCYTKISTSISSNGTINPAAGQCPVLIGSNKSFIYKPNTNYFTDSVIVNGVNNSVAALDTIYTFTNVTTPQTLRITFKTNTITASTSLYGTISPSGSVSVGKNGSQKFTFTPNTNCWLDSLIVDGINRPDSIPGKSFTFTNVNEPHTIRSVYNANIITATAGANGTISSSGATVMAPNSSKTYTITPSTNYFLDSLIIDGINRPDSIPNKRYTFNNVNEDHTIRVVFRTITIISSTGPNGTITPLGTTNKLPGSSQKYTITPNQYYFLDSLIVNDVNIPDSISGKSFTFNNINANQTIRVVFKTNYITPTLITPPMVVETPIQYNPLNMLTLSGGLVQHNDVDVPGTFTWTTPTTTLTAPGNYSVTFTPTDITSYFPITFDIFVNFIFTNLIIADGTTTNQYVPIYGWYLDNYNQKNQLIYPSSMLTPMIGREISSLTFYFSTAPTAAWTANLDV
ncbi:MAG: LamG-like jellyroll fold domain-containing protein, partial [Bacteroidales bacterium]|nr:LamG-like jellyroll fold domain-containing protein [Bacteroidales bacterium]